MRLPNELIDRFLDGDASEEERSQVLAGLESDDDNIRSFVARSELHADLRRSLYRRSIQQTAMTAVERTPAIDHNALHRTSALTSRLSARMTCAIVATVLATAASLAIMFLNGPRTQPIATLAHQSNARWADVERIEGDAIGAGVLDLEVGIVRVDFANGASVTLQGPTLFEVLGPGQARLHSGILTAHIPEPAVGFEVETPTLDVIDLGTAFGLSVGSDGETDVCVFEGEVEVSIAGSQSQQTPKRVREGNAVRTRPSAGGIETVVYQTARFEDSWPVTSGVLQTTGLMKFVSPGPEFVPGRYEDSEHILVFPERNDVVLETAVTVDLVEPGRYQRINRREHHPIHAGRRVRTFLLQFDPIGRLKKEDPNKTRVMGQITFDRPIVGLIGSTESLAATDFALGHPSGDYRHVRRGIEPPRQKEASPPGRDLVMLSQDRHTLSLELSAGSAVDQIRVVVGQSQRN